MDEFEGLVENSVLESEMLEGELEKQVGREKWESWVPLSTALLAVLATIAALLAAFSADRELEDRIGRIVEDVGRHHAVTQREIIKNREQALFAQGKTLPPAEQKALNDLELTARQDLEREEELEHLSEGFNQAHHILAVAITFFQVSIALSATALIARRKYLWGISLGMMGLGLCLLVYGGYFYWSLG